MRKDKACTKCGSEPRFLGKSQSVDIAAKAVSITSSRDERRFIAAIRDAGYDPVVDRADLIDKRPTA